MHPLARVRMRKMVEVLRSRGADVCSMLAACPSSLPVRDLSEVLSLKRMHGVL